VSGLRRGIRAGMPLLLPSLVIGVSFGVLAQPVMGSVAAMAMSLLVCGGSAQFAALSVLAGGGTAAAASAAGLLMNARFLPMGIAAASAMRGGRLRRAAESWALVDASWALASDGRGGFDRDLLLGAAVPQVAGWWSGTALGLLAGKAIGDPQALGLDAVFPAFYLALLVNELRSGRAFAAAVLAVAIALLLVPLVPPGLPILAAALAALVGLRRRVPRPDGDRERA
jgi:predicted branched-subunit amino acid permease